MKTKKFALISLTSIFLFNLLALNNFALAQYTAQNGAQQLCQNATDCPIQDINGIYRVLNTIVLYTYQIFFIVAVLFILFAAYTYLTAGGDPTKVTSATRQILYAAVAIAIALLSVGAKTIIQTFLRVGK